MFDAFIISTNLTWMRNMHLVKITNCSTFLLFTDWCQSIITSYWSKERFQIDEIIFLIDHQQSSIFFLGGGGGGLG